MKVSVITPTAHRPELLKKCVDMFAAQDYEDKELLLIGNPNEINRYSDVAYCIPAMHLNVGQKRNLGCSMAKGDIMVHMDDDDYYAPDWISRSVGFLLGSGADITGLDNAYFCQPGVRAWEYTYGMTQPYCLDATLCYFRRTWEREPFANVREGECRNFIANGGRVIPHGYKDGFVAILHGKNSSNSLNRIARNGYYREIPAGQFDNLIIS